jgi:repressor LexA
MARGLTQRQQEVLDFLKEFIAMHGYPPTLREIGDHFRMASTRASSDHLKALERKGCIRIQEGRSRGIQMLDGNGGPNLRLIPGMKAPHMLPLVGRIAAGPLTEAIEDVIDRISVDSTFVKADNSFLLEVQGDSMIDAHILPGDYIVVKPQATAESGDIVVALLGEEATVKRFEKKGNKVRLIPENATMEPIPVPDPSLLQIRGIVTGLIRRLR